MLGMKVIQRGHVQLEETSPRRCSKVVTGKSEDSHATEALWMERHKLDR
jgi:hypothetical protein